jgi:Tryptophan-associated transmembrane protein (Trp_oprn_chp)
MADQARSRRPLWIVTAALLGAAAALWVSSRLDWSEGLTGGEKVSALVPLALLYLAGIAGVLATSGWPRRIVGLLLAVAGVATGYLAFDGVSGQAGGSGTGLLARGLALVAAVAVVGAGVLLVRSGHRMPRLGTKYETPAAAKADQTGEKELWRALTEGNDPTV